MIRCRMDRTCRPSYLSFLMCWLSILPHNHCHLPLPTEPLYYIPTNPRSVNHHEFPRYRRSSLGFHLTDSDCIFSFLSSLGLLSSSVCVCVGTWVHLLHPLSLMHPNNIVFNFNHWYWNLTIASVFSFRLLIILSFIQLRFTYISFSFHLHGLIVYFWIPRFSCIYRLRCCID